MVVVCIYVYWCPTRFLYQIIFMSFNSSTTDATSGAGTSNPFRAHDVKQNVEQELLSFPEHLRFFKGSCSSIISFLCSVL